MIIEHDIDVVGVGFRLKKDLRETLATHLSFNELGVELEREPANKYDPNAIKVTILDAPYAGHFLGYVGRETAIVLAPQLDSGRVVVADAQLRGLNGPDYKSGTMHVYLDKEDE